MPSRSSAAATPSTVAATEPSSFWAGITTESFIASAMRRRRYRKSRICREDTREIFSSARHLLQLKHYARIHGGDDAKGEVDRRAPRRAEREDGSGLCGHESRDR